MPDNYESYIPVDRDGSSGELASNVYFMIRGLLASRVDTGVTDDECGTEDDVNVYLAHLLCDFLKPTFHERTQQYVSSFDTSVFDQVANTTDKRLKYTVYKTNADFILMMTGLFQNPTGKSSRALPSALRVSDERHVGRGKTYYDFAFTYGRSLFGQGSGITDVLGKLSQGFERYLRVLSHMRGDYLNLVERIGEGEIYHLQRDASRDNVDLLRNQFLDAYGEWHRDPDGDARERVEDLAARLRDVDPTFRFELPKN